MSTARSVRGFGPAAVHACAEVVNDVVHRLEHAVYGIGLVATSADGPEPVPAAAGRGPLARRRSTDRWVEELLYQAVLMADDGEHDR